MAVTQGPRQRNSRSVRNTEGRREMNEGNGDPMGLVGGITNTGTATFTGPKAWDECSTEQKLERLRQEVEGWRRQCAYLRDRVMALESHRHGADGAIMITLEQADRIHQGMNVASSINMLR